MKNKYCTCGCDNSCECKDPCYCESINEIINNEAKISDCTSQIMMCNVLQWLEEIPHVDKRIKIYTDFLEAYTKRINALGNLICSSTCLLKTCDNDECHESNLECNTCVPKSKYTAGIKIDDNIYLLERVIIVDKNNCPIYKGYLLFDSCKNVTFIARNIPIENCEGINTVTYCI